MNPIASDIDGIDPNEDSGYSISMSSSGDRLVIGSPGFDVTSNGFSLGALRIFEQKKYTSQPSLLPSSEPSITSAPSVSPSVSTAPSTFPSISMRPSVVPTLSTFPSLSPTQTSQPSDTPTLIEQREFKLMSRFEKFDLTREWCLTAFKKEYGSKVFIRPCKIYESKVENLQLWRFDSSSKLMLAGSLNEEGSGKFCLKSNSKSLTLQSCTEEGESNVWSFENNAILQVKKSKKYKIGFDPESRYERLHLFRDGSLNPTLQKWNLVASTDFASTIPSVLPSFNPSVSFLPTLSVATLTSIVLELGGGVTTLTQDLEDAIRSGIREAFKPVDVTDIVLSVLNSQRRILSNENGRYLQENVTIRADITLKASEGDVSRKSDGVANSVEKKAAESNISLTATVTLLPSPSLMPSSEPSASKMPSLQPSSLEISCPNGPFNITLMNMSNNTNYDDVFFAAKRRWESIIKCDLYDFQAGLVPDWFGNFFGTTYNGNVDDLVIGYEFKSNDGPGGILGFAGPTYTRSWTNSPVAGIMSFDSDDFEVMSDGEYDVYFLRCSSYTWM